MSDKPTVSERKAVVQEAIQYFRDLYGSAQIDVCGVRIAQDGVVL